MMIKILPKSKTGKWSVGFIVIFFALFGLMQLLVALGEQGGKNFFSNLKLAASGFFIGFFRYCRFFQRHSQYYEPSPPQTGGVSRDSGIRPGSFGGLPAACLSVGRAGRLSS